MFSPEERQRAVELYFTTPMTTAQVVKRLGYPTRQCLERWLAADPRYAGHMAKPIIPLETRTKAIELVLGGMQQKQAARQLGVSIGAVHNWVKAYREGGMAALQPRNRNASQSNKPAPRRSRNAGDGNDDAEALRRRVEELELENALMREVVEVVKKDPGADLRRLSNREKTLLIDRLRPAYSLSSMICLLGIAPSSYHYHHARLAIDKYAGLRTEVAEAFAASKGRYGYRRIKATLQTGVSEKVIRRIMAEDGLTAHVPRRRRYSSYEGETTPAPGNLVNRDFTAEAPNEKWLTDITEIKARDGKVYLSGMLAFSWRLNERIFVCPVPKNDSVRWNCIPPRRGQRPRWYGPGGRAPGLSDQAVTGTLAGKGFPVCWPYGQTGGAFLEVASQPFAGGTISRCWYILFTR